MAHIIDENELPLDEFIKLPTTVDFNLLYTDRIQLYLSTRPYLKIGEVFANGYVVVYTNRINIPLVFEELGHDFFGFFPIIMSPLDNISNQASGITQVLEQPSLDLSGQGVIIGFVDTGIDYTKDAFKFEDGSTKILEIWDQTVDGDRTVSPDRTSQVYFGSVYSQEKINEALASPVPLTVVPTMDEDGHGTFLASIAASNDAGEMIGAAPKANIIAVKLRRARSYYIERYLLPPENPNLYESTDFLLGLKYIADLSEELNMPVVFCVGMGSNMSGHDGNTHFEDFISFAAQRTGYAFVTAAGNESNAAHHTQGQIEATGLTDVISFNVGRQDTSFMMTILNPVYDQLSISITSPAGEAVPRVSLNVGLEYNQNFILENSSISIEYYRDVNNIIFIGFKNAIQGIWDITLFGDAITSGDYFAWLPITGQVSEYVEFLRPVPEYTIVFPATALRSTTTGAYNISDNSLYISSSWGPTRLPRIAPDFVAPGVGIRGLYPFGPGVMTGTSAAAAITCGAAALLFEWGIVQGNFPSMDGDLIRTLFIGGCTQNENMEYPNIQWGYGRLNLSGTLLAIIEPPANDEQT